MGFRAWLRQVLRTIQEKVDHFLGRGVRPEDEPNISGDNGTGTGTGSGNEESPQSPKSCICQRPWVPRQPSPHLPETNKEFYVEQGVPLYRATLNGDREKLQQILNPYGRTLLCSSITGARETALHVAVEARQVAVVKELVGRMESGDLELQDGRGNTAFCVAAATGSVNIAKILMDENADLAFIRGAENRTPLYIAAVCGYPEMLRFLYKKFEPHIPCLHEEEQRGIFFACIRAGLFDLAIRMLEVLGDVLAWPPNDDEETALEILARTPSAFAGKSSTTPKTLIDMCFGSNTINMQHNALKLTKFLCETMTSDQRKSYEETTDHASKLLFEAARFGNYNFLTVLVGFFPDLIFRKDEKRKSIFHIAVLHRHAGIFTHIHNLGLRKDLIMLYRVNYSDQENPIVYNMLHLAAKLPSLDRLNIVSGAALQMQRELLWFKEVENLTPPSEREMRDSKDELTPQELFTKEHEELRKAGETWMKKTAEAGMIVATIITTVVFTTASSLPGGTDGGDGSPKNKDKTMFHVFAVADSVAMCSSIVSTMMFLSILTSRYAEKDFLVRLPLKLAAAVTTLLVSMMALMVSFSAIYFLVYCQSKLKWVPILASALSFLPAALFVLLQYHLLPDVFRSAFGSRYIFRPNKSTFWESFNKIFNENVSN